MAVWIGTSGYSFTDWVGDFYPPGTPPGKMLPYYARHFPLVELNFTFYRPPTRAMLLRVADRAPAGFAFVVKVPRTISHEQNPHDLAGFHDAARGLHERGQLAGLLCQFPQSAHADRRTRGWVGALAREFARLRPAVEFRHRSWDRPWLAGWLRDLGVDLVSVDAPALPALFPAGLRHSGGRAYVRFHSRAAGNWYQGEKSRYDYVYTDAELGEWVDAVRGAVAAGAIRDVLFLFNNCVGGQAPANARRMRELLASRAPELGVVPPPAPPQPVQRSLFE